MNEMQRLTWIIAGEIPVERSRIVPTANFTTDLGANRTELISVILSVEDAFNIAVPISAMDKIQTVGDLAALVEGRRGD